MKNNNTEQNLNVILIRGNHEESDTSERYGFYNECLKKFNKDNTYNNFIDFFKYCPSAIILNHLDTRYWLCHGGFSIHFEKDYSKLKTIYNEKSTEIILIENKNINSSIRWADFTGNNNSSGSRRGAIKVYDIGNNDLKNFLSFLHIDFIIRGHNDNNSNAMLLKNKIDNKQFFYINEKKNIKEYISKINKNNKNNIIKYNTIFKNNNEILPKSNRELAIIYPKKFNKNDIKITNNLKLFPVLTISNNSDRDRSLYPDSYIIIENSINKLKSFLNNENSNTNRNSFYINNN